MSRALLVAILALGGCASPAPLEGRGCPCATGYTCCGPRCIRESEVCPAPEASDAAADPAAPPDAAPDLLAAPDLVTVADVPMDRAAPRDLAPDAAPDRTAEPIAPPPRWQALGEAGLAEHLALWFDLQVAADGTPFVAMEKHTPPGRSRVTIVLRYDGVAWQKVGADLPGAEVAAFALAPDGTPTVASFGAVYTFQQGQWKQLPDVGQGLGIPTHSPAIGLDASGRLHAIVADLDAVGALSVVRFNGTGWDLVGRRGGAGPRRLPALLAFDGKGAYVASMDAEMVTTDVRRASGSDWLPVGGRSLFPFTATRLVVAPDGTAYAIEGDVSAVETRRALPSGSWGEVDRLSIPYVVTTVAPAVDLTPEGILHVAYLADRDPGPDIVPGASVVRLDGTRWSELTTAGLDPNVFDSIALDVARRGTRDVPHIAYVRYNRMIVKKLE